jgi:hypothetical protein
MSIPETLLKIKPLGVVILKTACLILILGIVFSLGRISGLSVTQTTEPIEVVYPPLVKTSVPQYNQQGNSTEPESWAFAGSKTGKTYYPKDCSSLTRVKPENRVYFSTRDQAVTAGYHASTACK